MNKPFIKEWVKALRSGEFKQIQGQLQTRDGFCCLGVACRIAGDAGLFNFSLSKKSGRLHGAYLPAEMHCFVNLGRAMFDNLITLNDNKDFNFNQIADYIEEKANLKE